MKRLLVGVSGFQGDVEEHLRAVESSFEHLGVAGEAIAAKSVDHFEKIDALIIPGGESTVMGLLASFNRSIDKIRERVADGMPVLGTCAGLILLSGNINDRVRGKTGQPNIGSLDVSVERNSFGRQKDSFEAYLDIPKLGSNPFKGVFIRAPTIIDAGSKVERLSILNGKVVAVQQGNILGTAFHPELSGDLRLHEFFLQLVLANS